MFNPSRKVPRATAILFAFALLAAACGSDAAESTTSDTTPDNDAAEVAETEEEPVAEAEEEPAETDDEPVAEAEEEEPADAEEEPAASEVDQVGAVVALLESLGTGDSEAAAIISPEQYTQHNLQVADGLEGFEAFTSVLPTDTAPTNVVRAFEDGEFVFTHSEFSFFGPATAFDIFRFEDGLIVEHWDNLQATPEALSPGGWSMVDGATEATDLDLTEENKELVERFARTVLFEGNFDELPTFFDGDNYIQHSPQIADGVTGLTAAFGAFAEQGIDVSFDELHFVLGQGNFVLLASEGSIGGAPTAFYDLFRVENGFIAEHWDVIETILPVEDHQNANGKF